MSRKAAAAVNLTGGVGIDLPMLQASPERLSERDGPR